MTKPHFRLHKDGSVTLLDGLTNLVANLGTSRDKAFSSHYQFVQLSDMGLLNAYRGAWLPRKIVDIPAYDSIRAWRNWQAEADQITKIEEVERRLGLKQKVLKARIAARLYGGSALLIGTQDTNPELPLVPDSKGTDGLRYLALLYRRQLSAGPIDPNPESPTFALPAYWNFYASNAGSGMANIKIHPSRLIFFSGPSIPDETIAGEAGVWGDSVLHGVFDAVRNLDATAANVASLVFEAKVDTVGIPNLMTSLGSSEYEATLLRRWQLAETGKGINGTLIHDSEEVLGQKTASFASLPELMDRFMQLAAGAADIPMTRLLGQSPAGLNATGDSDLRNYYDRISSEQELFMTPAMSVLDELIIKSALGNRPEEIHYEWASLWQTSAKEQAEIGKIQVEMIKTLKDTALIPNDPLSEAAVTLLSESGVMPGLEGAVTTFYEENPNYENEDPAEEGQLGTDPEEATGVEDASAPARTLYVSRKVLNAADLIAWAEGQGIPNIEPADELHVTLIYSRKAVDWMKAGEPWVSKLELPEGGPRVMSIFGQGALVLQFASSELEWRHSSIRERTGASFDYAEYNPHITIAKVGDGFSTEAIEPYTGPIVFGPELFEEVKEDARMPL